MRTVSKETDALLDEYDNAAYLGSNLDVDIAKGKLRGHIAVIESERDKALEALKKAEARLRGVRKAVDMYWSVGGFLAAAVSRVLDEK